MGPFKIPWSTFLAYVVVIFSILLAIGWAVIEKRREKKRKGKR